MSLKGVFAAVLAVATLVSAASAQGGGGAGGFLRLDGYEGVATRTYTRANAFLVGGIGSLGHPYGPPQETLFTSAAIPDDGTGDWQVTMIPPLGSSLAPGTYSNAGDFGAFPNNPVLIVHRLRGQRCAGGAFEIHALDRSSPFGISYRATWSQTCDGLPASGEVVIEPPPDEFAPLLIYEPRQFALATGPDGAAIDYQVSARDDRDPSPDIACTPPTGSTLPIGESSVTCAATDDAGNSRSATFQVFVVGAFGQLIGLREDVRSLPDSDEPGGSLGGKLDNAIDALDEGRIAATCGLLNGFTNQVRALGAALPDGERFVSTAERVARIIECA